MSSREMVQVRSEGRRGFASIRSSTCPAPSPQHSGHRVQGIQKGYRGVGPVVSPLQKVSPASGHPSHTVQAPGILSLVCEWAPAFMQVTEG